jgi:ABC-type glutathione transport system ATPase component
MAEATMAQTTSDGPLLQVRNVDIEYRTRERQVRATHDVSFDVWPGDRFILLGPSGCGKSSLLKAAGAFLRRAAVRCCWKGNASARPAGADDGVPGV